MGMDLTKYKILDVEIDCYKDEDETQVYDSLFIGYDLNVNEIKILDDLNIPYFIKKNFDENYISEKIFKKLKNLDNELVEIIFDYSKDTFIVLNNVYINLFTYKFNELNGCYNNEKYDILAKEYSELYYKRIENIDGTYGKSYKFSDYNIPFILSYRIKNMVKDLENIGKPFLNNNESKEEYKRILNLGLGKIENCSIILTSLHNNYSNDFSKLITDDYKKNIFNSLFPLNNDEIIRIDW